MCPRELSVFMATPAIKAKFKYPTKDPEPNLITDNRSDSAKVSDIIRIWSQVLRKDEQVIWNGIAERDISKAISLPSGMRIPKSFIEKDIRAFYDLHSSEKALLLKHLEKTPNTPFKSTALNSHVSSD